MSEQSKSQKSYTPPRVVFHSRDEILRRSGPAIGCARWSIVSRPDKPEQQRLV
jgi:hypothetical protein